MKMKKNIRIFVDCHVFDYGFQGTRTYIQGIYKEFIKDDSFDFYFAANNIENLKTIFGVSKNIFYVKYSFKNKFLRLLIDIPKILKREKIDYAHFQYIVPPIKKSKYIVTTHDLLFIDFPVYFTFLNRIKNTFLYKKAINKADIKLTVSEYSKQRIVEHFNIDVKEIQITPNAVDSIFFRDYDKTEIIKRVEKKYSLKDYIIYVSRWEPRKNHELILKAFVDLKLYETNQLLFIGDTTTSNKSYSEIYDNINDEIKNKIICLQKLDFESMLMLLRGAKVSIYPSFAEGFGIPPLESIAAKIPTISSNQTAMSDYEFMDEFLFDPNDYEELKVKLKKILENDYNNEFKLISNEIKEKYTWFKSMSVLKDCIQKKL
jgi:glycosyltransferase involved in cell wall biosynthesis